MHRALRPAPASRVAADRRGLVVGRYCLACHSVYPLHRGSHSGKPVVGRDHLASPCVHEGDAFGNRADWWEPAVEVRPPQVETATEG